MTGLHAHSTACIDPAAVLGDDVRVGPFAVIEPGAHVGHGCKIAAHAVIKRHALIGDGCEIGEHAVIGGDPQDLAFDRSSPNRVVLGEKNILREGVTIHRGTKGDTIIGHRNYLMGGVHLGHDVVIGDDCVLANNVLLAGHVQFANRIVVGGGTVFHQFMRVGSMVMVQGGSKFGQDLLPFTMAVDYNTVAGLNRVGLRRAGYDPATREAVRRSFDRFYRSGLTPRQFLENPEDADIAPVAEMLEFVRAGTKRGFCRLVAVGTASDEES